MVNLKMILMVSTILLSTKSCLVEFPPLFGENSENNSAETSGDVESSVSTENSQSSVESSNLGGENSDSTSNEIKIESLTIENGDVMTLEVGTSLQLNLVEDITGVDTTWTVDNSYVTVDENGLVGAINPGLSEIKVSAGGTFDTIYVRVVEDIPETDPFTSVSKTQFYADYKPAQTYEEAVYRSQHNLMSGSIESQDQAPTLAKNQPKQDGKYVRNTHSYYSNDFNTYYVVDENGEIVNQVFKGGAYVTLEEVAAYIFAFNEIPANYTSKKSGSPSSNPWGKYLRLNHSKFSGDTSKYPYEPVLPNISGCGGSYYYYELDIGTTGTDCDPSYDAVEYNNGSRITRGAARIVYSNSTTSGKALTDINEKYLFYTYNHYNDFQEYLNYQGGWGEMFGNITGGGTISSKTDYNPTVYEEVVRMSLVNK